VHHLDADQVDAPLGRGLPRGQAHFAHLRRKLRWQLLVAYVTPLLLLSLYFHYSFHTTLREGMDTHLRSVAENKRNTVELYLQERVANVRSAFPEDIAGLSGAQDRMDLLLARLVSESPAFTDVGVFDPSGKMVAYAGPPPSLAGKDYSEEAWFRRVHSDARGHIISDVFLGFREKPHFVVAVARPIGGQAWVLRASVDPDKFASFVGGVQPTKGVEACVVNEAGQRQTGMDGGPGPLARMPSRDGPASVFEMEHEGRSYVAAVSWLSETDWAVVVRVPRDQAYASVHRTRLILTGIMLVTLGLIVVIVVRSTRKLVHQLEQGDQTRHELRGQLFNAAKLASVGEMAAGVAHEINNPLAIIYEEAGALKDSLDPSLGERVDDEELRERLDQICEATMRGRAITRKLLVFSRQHDEAPVRLDVNELLDRVLEMKATEFSVSNIAVTRELGEGISPILASRNQMEQVLFNLLNNAKDAIAGGGRITVRTRRDDRFVHIDVQDTGCGMTAEQMEKVFFPFFTTKAVGKGTGLGLSISYGIVKSHGGRIEVSSEVGEGTTFTISLPFARENGSQNEPPERG